VEVVVKGAHRAVHASPRSSLFEGVKEP